MMNFVLYFGPAVLALVGGLCAGQGTMGPVTNPGGAPHPARMGMLMFGIVALLLSGLGIYVSHTTESVEQIQKLPLYHAFGFGLTAVVLGILGFLLAANGDCENNVIGEMLGSAMIIAAVVLAGYCVPSSGHKILRESFFPPVATAPAISGPVTVQASGPTGTISTTVQPATGTPTAPAPATLPKADVSKIVWSAAKPKEVTFPPPISSGQQWVIKHDAASGTVVDFVVGTTYAYADDLVNVRAYEVDISDITKPKPLHLATPVPKQP